MPPRGIRNHSFSRRTAADLRLRPRGHLDRINIVVMHKTQNQHVPGDYTQSDKIGQPLFLHLGFESSAEGIRMKIGKGKVKGHTRTDHEGPEGEQMYSSTLPSTSAIDREGSQHHAPAVLPARKTRYPLYTRLGGPQGRSG
jgi:hypothetical protein